MNEDEMRTLMKRAGEHTNDDEYRLYLNAIVTLLRSVEVECDISKLARECAEQAVRDVLINTLRHAAGNGFGVGELVSVATGMALDAREEDVERFRTIMKDDISGMKDGDQ